MGKIRLKKVVFVYEKDGDNFGDKPQILTLENTNLFHMAGAAKSCCVPVEIDLDFFEYLFRGRK